MRDATAISYEVTVYGPDGTPRVLPHSGLTWARSPGERATRVGFSVPDLLLEDGAWTGSLIGDGLPLLVHATDETGTRAEVIRGRVRGWRKGLAVDAPIEVRGYDPLFELLGSDYTAYFPAGSTGLDVLGAVAVEFGIPLGQVDGLTSDVGPLRFVSKTVSTVLGTMLKRCRLAGEGDRVLRWRGPALEIVRPGANATVYWFREGESVLGGEEDASTEALVTRARVYRTATAPDNTPVRDARGQYVLATASSSPPALLATLDGNTAFGVFQKTLVLKENDDADAAIAAARATLQLSGTETKTLRVIAPLLPDVLDGDRVRVTAGTVDGYGYVAGHSADAETATMQLSIVADTAGFSDQFTDTDLSSDGLNASDTVPTGLAALAAGGGAAAGGSRHAFDPNTPTVAQTGNWQCSAASLAWLLRSLGVDASQDAVVAAAGGHINATVGLDDATGAPLVAIARQYGVVARNGPIGFSDALALAGQAPLIIGGGAWDHWSAVRGRDGEALVLANPDAGGGPPYNLATLDAAQFRQYGPFYAVWAPQ